LLLTQSTNAAPRVYGFCSSTEYKRATRFVIIRISFISPVAEVPWRSGGFERTIGASWGIFYLSGFTIPVDGTLVVLFHVTISRLFGRNDGVVISLLILGKSS